MLLGGAKRFYRLPVPLGATRQLWLMKDKSG
jgi:hypothetical protein